MQHGSARDVALRIGAACFGSDSTCAHTDGLEPFQADARHRLRDIIERRGGAILADSVGLGKTHVAVAIIRDELSAGGTAIVVAPAQLRAHWRRHLKGMPRCRWISHTALSRDSRRTAPARLIVVDEAHAFRNPLTRRYAALALLCEHARVLLVTATPVNNSLLDFYHLLRLFAARDLFADVGVPDLLAAVESAVRGGSGAELRRVANAVMVRRTRRAVMSWQSGTLAPALRFPACAPIEIVHYGLCAAWPGLVSHVQRVIPALTFPAHGLDGDVAPRELMRLGLLKRLESSSWALHASVRRHIRLLDHFIAAASDGLLFDPRRDHAHDAEVDGALQLSLQAVTLRPWPAALDRARLVAAAGHDLRLLRELGEVLARPADSAEPKLLRLRELLDACDDKVLLFTEYQETARGLWRALAGRGGVALVHGGDARLGRDRAGRRTVIERFAPIANHARAPRPAERVRLLIATDVLAEGLNLQDAAVVVSYDLPWNPVRLAQRTGRIDRLGSPHAVIRAVAFVPDHGIDELLGLMKRIRRKLRHIRIVGGDAPWSLAAARRSVRVIDEIDAAGDARERVRALWRRLAKTDGPSGMTTHAASHAPGSSVGNDRKRDRAISVGVMSWHCDHDAALCCLRVGRETLLFLMSGDRPARVDSTACWSVFADALNETVPDEEPDTLSVAAAARAAGRAARKALHRARNATIDRPGSGSAPAADAVLRWLARRPGGPSSQEAERADAILRRLATGGRAGTDIRVQRATRAGESPDHAVQSLFDISRDCGSSANAAPGVTRTPELVAVLLLRRRECE